MGYRHHGHGFGDCYWHHSYRHHFHHHKQDYAFGTRGDDVLYGSDRSSVLFGRKGNDELFGNGGNDRLFGGRGNDQLFGGDGRDKLEGGRGNDLLDGGAGNDRLDGGKGDDELFGGEGNDKLYGGRGNDLLDGGAGNDRVFGGKGDDIAVYSMTENAGNGGCGRGDFYDGGEGNNDVLRLILTAEELADANVQADIAAFEAFLAANPSGCGNNGEVFKFTSFDLTVRNFEALEIPESGTPPQANTPPQALADDFTVTEDTPLILDVHTNDSDADGDSLSAVIVNGPAHGRLDVNPDGSLTYTPEDDYFGPDGFSYRASDGIDVSEAVDVTLDVLPENDAPELKDPDDLLVWEANKSQLIFIDVLDHYAPGPANEVGQTVTIKSIAPVGLFFGNLFGVNPDNKIVYMAPGGIPPGGHETIAFEIEDNLGAVTSAELQIDIL